MDNHYNIFVTIKAFSRKILRYGRIRVFLRLIWYNLQMLFTFKKYREIEDDDIYDYRNSVIPKRKFQISSYYGNIMYGAEYQMRKYSGFRGRFRGYFEHGLYLGKAADEAALTAIPDIGGIVAGSVIEYFSFPENNQMIERLFAAGVHPGEMHSAAEGVFSGMSIVVTGTLPTLSRKQAEDLIRSRGGNASGSVSKKTAFVVVGEDAGSKLTKAQSLGIETIDEAELLRRAES